jgi:hypothetical protein
MIMSNPALPLVLSADDEHLVERELAELRESSDGTGTISLFFPDARQVLVLIAQDGDIVSWCLMPAGDQERAYRLTVLFKRVVRRELEIVCRDVKALAEAAIDRASGVARQRLPLREACDRRTDTYPGEWDRGEV